MTARKKILELADILLKNGFRVWFCELEHESSLTWLYASVDGKLATVEYRLLDGKYKYMTVHKPNYGHGTGFCLASSSLASEVLTREACETISPSWARNAKVVKYSGPEDWLQNEKVLEYIEINSEILSTFD